MTKSQSTKSPLPATDSKLLQGAHAIQDLAGRIGAMREAGRQDATFDKLLLGMMTKRRRLVSRSVKSPVDALVLTHLMAQAAAAVSDCAASDEPATFHVLAGELLLAVSSIAQFMEREAGVTLTDLRLGPVNAIGTLH